MPNKSTEQLIKDWNKAKKSITAKGLEVNKFQGAQLVHYLEDGDLPEDVLKKFKALQEGYEKAANKAIEALNALTSKQARKQVRPGDKEDKKLEKIASALGEWSGRDGIRVKHQSSVSLFDMWGLPLDLKDIEYS